MLNRTAYPFDQIKFKDWLDDIQGFPSSQRLERLEIIARRHFLQPSNAARKFLSQETRYSFESDFDYQTADGSPIFWVLILIANSVGDPIQVGSHLTIHPYLVDMLSIEGWNDYDIRRLVFGRPFCETFSEQLDWCNAPEIGRISQKEAHDFYDRLLIAEENLSALVSLPSVSLRNRDIQNALNDNSRNDAKLSFELTLNAIKSAVDLRNDLIIAMSD